MEQERKERIQTELDALGLDGKENVAPKCTVIPSPIEERLAAIESLLQRLPEIQAAVLFQMLDEYQNARASGKKASDLWEVPTPDQR